VDSSEQALINLLDNALKHTQDSVIEIMAQTIDDKVPIAVSDNGTGISEKDKERIFDKFQRGENPRAEGTALGLAICKGIIQAHGGQMVRMNLRIPVGAHGITPTQLGRCVASPLRF